MKKNNFAMIIIVYLAGIFMGAIDTGIVTPARTIIQNNLSVDEKTGIWMITIYTLAYAASIPITGKLADKYGRKYIYLTSIFLFGLGSLFCGLAHSFGGFSFLLFGRVVQAIGGGGIMPIATAEFGTSFPDNKRGMALGLVGGVYGIANIFGASAGSAILDIFGINNWQFIFYINIPITLFILIGGYLFLENNKISEVKPTDIMGIMFLTVMVLFLMYGLKNIDFFNFSTLYSNNVYPYLIGFLVLLPIFILVEKKAKDPVLNLSFFTNPSIIITFIISLIVGVILMGMIFVPQFAENALQKASGSGGYFVIILGLFAGVGAPLSGKLIDKYGPKIVLGAGFLISVIGSCYIIFVTINHPNMINTIVGLILMGLGMGFTIGTPLNYMMLENTKKEESNSALATLSLVRSIGTVIAPTIMVGFLAHAGADIQSNIFKVLPSEIAIPSLPYSEEVSKQTQKLKNNPNFNKMNFNSDQIPKSIKVNFSENKNSNMKIPKDIVDKLKSSDVTTITQNTILITNKIFDQMKPLQIQNASNGIQSGISGLETAVSRMKESENPQANEAILKNKLELNDLVSKLKVQKDAIPTTFDKAQSDYIDKIKSLDSNIKNIFQNTLNQGFKQIYLTVSFSSIFAILILMFYRKSKVE